MREPTYPGSVPARRFTVLVVDDHPMVAHVIAHACEERGTLDVVGVLTSGAEAIEACRRLSPDVLVLDLGMPKIDGFEVIRQLNLSSPRATRILAITGDDNPEIILRCMRTGVEGLVEKTWPAGNVAAAVEAVAAGTYVFSGEQSLAVQPVLAEMARRSREAKIVSSSLTRREREVLELVVRGYSNRQVARSLAIAERTVESHLFGVYGKLGVQSRVQATRRAVKLGLVHLAPSVPDPAAGGVRS